MTRARILSLTLVALAVVLGANCSAPQTNEPPPCRPIATVAGRGVDPSAVWGFADLHAHPAIELAFGGRLIWGTALDDAPIDSSELPVIGSCPVETHDPNASTPIDHLVGGIAFPAITSIAKFAHGPVGDLTYRPSSAWPNARDVIHQQMNVASIRRAYEGGLRLMFASTTDNQALAAILQGPNFINAFVPDPNADWRSAQQQLELIDRMVEQNETWMDIARTPGDARRIIGEGRLALVLSLEMDGVTQSQLDSLVSDYGVRHIIPVHLIDNDVGGTAANSDLFNTASAEISEIYRADQAPLGFMDVAPSTEFSRMLGWAHVIGPSSPPLYASFQQLAFPAYQALCYEPLSDCSGQVATTTPFVELGQVNFRGLCSTRKQCASGARPGMARVAHMMGESLFVDVSHMSNRAVEDTLKVSPPAEGGETAAYPLMASHGDFAHLCDSPGAPAGCVDGTLPSDPISPSVGTERSLRADYAREIVARHGVFGLGTGTGTYGARTIVDARGGALLRFDLSSATAKGCVAKPDADGSVASGCQPIPSLSSVEANPALPIQTLEVRTIGGVSLDPTSQVSDPNAHPFVRVELLGPDGRQSQRRVIVQPLDCSSESCVGSVALGDQDDSLALTDHANGSVTVGSNPAPIGACTSLCSTPGSCEPKKAARKPYTIDHVNSVTLEWLYLGCDLTCQESSETVGQGDLRCQNTWGSDRAPLWTIDEASLVAMSGTHATPLVQLGPRVDAPVTRIGQSRGTFTLYQRGDRPSANGDVPATGHLLRVSLTAGSEADLAGASTVRAGANVCVAVRRFVDGHCAAAAPPAPGAIECPTSDGWAMANQRGAWGAGKLIYTFVRFPGLESEVCGVDVAVLDGNPADSSWTVDEVQVEAIEDPVGHFIRRYADVSREVADRRMGTVAFGTDFNGLNGLMDISEDPMPEDAHAASACLVSQGEGKAEAPSSDVAPLPLSPMRIRHADGSLGYPVRIDERGLATYGLLADMMSIIEKYPGCGHDVHDSLMLSAEATIRAWETILDPGKWAGKPLPQATFHCDPPAGLPK